MSLFGIPFKPSFLNRSLVCSAVLLALLTGQGRAQETDDLTFQAILKQTGTWSSNPLMSLTDKKPLWKSTTSPEIVFKTSTGPSLVSVRARVDENNTNRSAFNSTDVHVNVEASTRNERWMFGVKKRFDYDTSRTSELTNYGLSSVVVRHWGFFIAPEVSFSPTTIERLSVSASFLRSKYDSSVFTNYDTYSANASYLRNLDPLNSGIFSVQAQRYETTRNNARKIDSIGPSLGWQTSLSPQVKADASVGAQTSREYAFGTALTNWSWQYVFSGNLSFEGEVDTLNIGAARSQYPYGNGTQALQTTFSINETHRLNSAVSLNAGASYRTATYQTSAAGNLESLADASVGATYHMTDTFDCTFSYRYRHETLTNINKTVQDNTVMIGLAYRPDVRALWE